MYGYDTQMEAVLPLLPYAIIGSLIIGLILLIQNWRDRRRLNDE